MEYFSKQEVSKGIYRIVCPGYVFAYLAIGKEKAALIDTGYGLSSIKEYVESITKLPLTVILTHGHFDHVGGIMEFDKVYLADEDMDMIPASVAYSRRKFYVCDSYGFPEEELKKYDKDVTLLSLKAFQEFDLGDLTLQMIPLPGHTHGSMCVLFKEAGSILVGDALNSFCMLMFEQSTSVEVYCKSLKNLKKYEDLYDTVLYSHPGNFGGKEILDEMIEICEDLLNGKNKGSLLRVTEREGDFYLSCERGQNGRRIDGKAANLLYERIR